MTRQAVAVVIAAVAAVPFSIRAADLTVDNSLSNSPFEFTADAAFSKLYVGAIGDGEVRQTAGTLSVSTELRLGQEVTGNGTYRLDGGTLDLTTPNSNIGFYGTGHFVQTGGTVTTTRIVNLARLPGSTGTYTQYGGTATISSLYIGTYGTGTFTLNGGTLNAGIKVSYFDGGRGTLNLDGGVFQTSGVSIGPGTGGMGNAPSQSTINYNGTTVRPTSGLVSLSALDNRVRTGGAIFDTAVGQTLFVNTLLHEAALGVRPDGGLTKLGAGTLVLDGTNTYTGDTVISDGVVELASFNVSLNTSQVRFNGGTLRYGSIDSSVPLLENFLPKFAALDGQAIQVDTASNIVPYSSAIVGTGTNLTKLGTGTFELRGVNTYTGTTTVNAGTLNAARPAALPGYDTPDRVHVNGNAVLGVSLDGWSGTDVHALLSAAPFAGNGGLGLNAPAADYAIGDDLGGPFRLYKLGTGSLTLSGSNTFTGGVTVRAGTLVATRTAALPRFATAGQLLVGPGATLGIRVGGANEWTPADVDSLRQVEPFTAGGTLQFDTTGGDFVYGGAFAGSVSLAKAGANTLTLTGPVTYTTPTVVRGGTLLLTNATLGTGFVGGVLNLSSGGTLTLAGGSKLTFPYNSAYSLNGGSIILSDTAALYGSEEVRVGDNGTGSVVQNGGTFAPGGYRVVLGSTAGASGAFTFNGGTINAGTMVVGDGGNGTLIVNGGVFTAGASAAITVASQAGSSGVVRLNGGSARFYGLRGGTGTSTVYLNGTTLSGIDGTTVLLQNLTKAYVSTGGLPVDIGNTFATLPQNLSHDPALGTTPDGGLTKLGIGTLTLSGTNSYTGPTAIAGGTLVVVNNGNGSPLGDGGTIYFSGGTLALSGNYGIDYASRFAKTGNQPISVDVRGATAPFYGNITGPNTSFTKSGTGLMILGGSNSYTGKTTVTAGQLTASTPDALPGYDTAGRVDVMGNATLAVTASGWTVPQINALAANATFGPNTALGLDLYGFGQTATLAGGLGGNVRYAKTGSGDLTLDGPNTFTGGLSVLNGTAIVTRLDAMPGYATAGKVTVASNGTLILRVGGTDEWTASTVTSLQKGMIVGTLSLDTTNAPDGFTYNDRLSGLFTLGKFGPNTLTVTASQSYSGSTLVRDGTLAVTSGGRIGGFSARVGGGTLAISGSGVINTGASSFNSITVYDIDGPRDARLSVADTGLLSTGTIYIGGDVPQNYFGRGEAAQSGGTVTTNGNSLLIASSPASYGAYELSGGTLTTGSLSLATNVGSVGSFTQSGGTASTGNNNIIVGGGTSSNSYGTTLGTYTQAGGTMSTGAGALVIGNVVGSNGVVTLTGGRLRVARIYRNSTSASGTLNFNGGTLSPTASVTAFLGGLSAANVQTGGAIFNTVGFDISVAQALLHDPALATLPDGGLIKAGNGTLTLGGANTYTGTTSIQSGTLRAASLAVTPLLTNAGGIDLTGPRTKLLIDHTAGSPVVVQVRALLASGFANGFASGQIRSTTATATRGLGYVDFGTTFTVMATLYGDADLDGGVSINDFNILAANFGSTGSQVWGTGDFDYDGGVSINDFNLLAGNFGQLTASGSAAVDYSGLLAFAAAHDDLAAFEAVTGVPEPTASGIVALVAGFGLRRQRRVG